MRDGRSAGYWIKAVRENDGKEFKPSAGFQVDAAREGEDSDKK
jgi:hypothetical protein